MTINMKLTIKADGTQALDLINGTLQELEGFAAAAMRGQGRANVAVVREIVEETPGDDPGGEV